ncbi:MAG: ribosome-associated translation inhibitor RaiA [Atribacterota bacterium]|jgi:putative sigma-54 modulation protein|nr:ribosome-associated translation inhibitor RaiA [Atribacterota bacterium]MDD4896856.1 ribosome-associated translation inhibitor RaiA [Atribacterota bacterium]MDD5637523.1 ribosome-associated translation inhibitor RaiA [Atribacterota bacterium]
MNLIIKGKQFEVTDSIENYIRKKMKKLEKYFDQIIEAVATISVEKNRHIFEVTLQAKKAMIRAEEESDNIYNSIDRVIEKLERQIVKYKEKLYSKYANEYNREVNNISEKEEYEIGSNSDQDRKIVKTKRFAIKPMSPEEASLQMELLGHNFYVFSNEETAQINVIYKRKDGNFGLIEPEV